MTITAEELRKVYEDEYERVLGNTPQRWIEAEEKALLAVARFVAEKQRAVEPTMEMVFAGGDAVAAIGVGGLQHEQRAYAIAAYRAMQSVAPLVVPE